MPFIRIAALDGAKSNFGIAVLDYDLDSGALSVADLVLVKTQKSSTKTVRKSSDNLRRAQEIAQACRAHLKDCAIVFGEVPSGAQSADALHAFGIIVGIYASLEQPFCEVSPAETKLASLGTRTASKQEIIEWAVEKFPKAPWRMVKRNGLLVPTQDNEHLADAVAIAHAGVRTPQFRQTEAIVRLASK